MFFFLLQLQKYQIADKKTTDSAQEHTELNRALQCCRSSILTGHGYVIICSDYQLLHLSQLPSCLGLFVFMNGYPTAPSPTFPTDKGESPLACITFWCAL